ncbi:MAG TPA: serine hydrolase domain-containing protein [Steroidobacteraceae bacterium]|nr:serine hydrolase domain-containing protein [Steroidobacteraceae bacterium]
MSSSKLARRWPALVALLLAAFGSAASGADLSPDQRDRIASAVAVYMQRSHTPAVSVYVDRGGSPLYRTDVGIADEESKRAVDADSIYAIGSITKSFTAHAVLSLVAAGKLRLEDTVGSVLADYGGPAKAVTIEQLLEHTSGIPNYVNEIPGLLPRLHRGELTRQEMLATFSSMPLLFAPGTRWSYSNSGYYLLGLIVERVSGKSYYDYLRDDVLKPLGITRVWSGDDRQILPHRVHGYEIGAAGLENATPWYYLVPFSAGSLMTTAEELARYRRAVFTSSAVSPEVRTLITTDRPLAGGERTGYTLGAMSRTQFGGLEKFAHSGEIWGFSASNAYYPAQDTVIVVLTNSKQAVPSAVSLERSVARVLFGIPEPSVPASGTRDRAVKLADYTGKYSLGAKRIGPPALAFAAKGDDLYFGYGDVADTSRMLRLVRVGRDRFVLADDPETGFEFRRRSPSGPVYQVVLDAFNGYFDALRTP